MELIVRRDYVSVEALRFSRIEVGILARHLELIVQNGALGTDGVRVGGGVAKDYHLGMVN